jgi:hypothetical protein
LRILYIWCSADARAAAQNRREARVGHANHGFCKLWKHPDKKALTWFDEQQVDVLVRDSWGDVGHVFVCLRRDDAAPERRWSVTVFDHENRSLLTAHSHTKQSAQARSIDALKALGHSPTGYRSNANKPARPADETQPVVQRH